VQVLTLLTFLLLGTVLNQTKIIGDKGTSILNKSIIYFFIPLITLSNIIELNLNIELIWLTISSILVFALCWLFFKGLNSSGFLSRVNSRTLILTCGISSTSFVGFPMFESFYGQEGLILGVFLSIGGTILVFNTLGMGLLMFYGEEKLKPLEFVHRIFTFFPFVVFLAALLLNILGFSFSPKTNYILQMLIAPFGALAMIAIGLQLEFRSFQKFRFEIYMGLAYKLILAPLLVLGIGLVFFSTDDLILRISVLGAAIGPMNAMAIMTAEKNLQPKLATTLPAIGIPLSIANLILFNSILNHI